MSREELLYLFPYLVSLAVAAGVLYYALKYRKVKGGRAYAWHMIGQVLGISGFIFEVLSPSLQTKILWDKFQWLAQGCILIPAFVAFAVEYSETKPSRPNLFWTILFGIPVLFNLLVVTDEAHHLIYAAPRLVRSYPYNELIYDFTTAVYVFAIYIYFAPFYGIFLLLKNSFRRQRLFRRQAITVTLGFFIPIALSILTFFGISITPQRDSTPITFIIGNLIVAWGLFRYGTFQIVPVAWEQVIRNINDPVLVFDETKRLVDINPAGARFLEQNANSLTGLPAGNVFQAWPDFKELLEDLREQNVEISIQKNDDVIFLDVTISHIYNQMNTTGIGWAMIIHDITRAKTLEASYRILSTELEQRVRERTGELHEIAERYRMVVENQREFVVRWNPDGVRTFVNEAYCRYFQITFEEACSENFMPLIAEEDRSAITDKINRLKSGVKDVETETHRVLKPDGTMGWQEWTDQAIRDEHGNLVEFLSTGRDVTERVLAEQKLAEAYDSTLEGWSHALDLRDKETEGHTRRVTETTIKLAQKMGLSDEEIVHIKRGSLLHDIGKMGIPDSILLKPQALTEQEWDIMKKHPVYAYEMLSRIEYLKPALDIPYCHHERWDGKGYPRKLEGEHIPLSARIFAIIDVWDALSNDRPYRAAWEKDMVMQHIKEQSGRHFDPLVVSTFLGMMQTEKIN